MIINGHNIEISEDVIKTLYVYRQLSLKDKENGGIILGAIRLDGTIVIKEIHVCSIENKRKRYSFQLDTTKAQRIIDESFQKSAGKCIYIGEWHTHPDRFPTPSVVDLKSVSELLKGQLNEPFIILIIVGINDMYVNLYKKENTLSVATDWGYCLLNACRFN